MSMRRVEPDHFVLDARNWMCPYPKYLCEHVFPQTPSGSRIDVFVDCASAVDDIPRLALRMGYRVLEVTRIAEGEWRITVQNR